LVPLSLGMKGSLVPSVAIGLPHQVCGPPRALVPGAALIWTLNQGRSILWKRSKLDENYLQVIGNFIIS